MKDQIFRVEGCSSFMNLLSLSSQHCRRTQHTVAAELNFGFLNHTDEDQIMNVDSSRSLKPHRHPLLASSYFHIQLLALQSVCALCLRCLFPPSQLLNTFLWFCTNSHVTSSLELPLTVSWIELLLLLVLLSILSIPFSFIL